jgi:hypothetical protein
MGVGDQRNLAHAYFIIARGICVALCQLGLSACNLLKYNMWLTLFSHFQVAFLHLLCFTFSLVPIDFSEHISHFNSFICSTKHFFSPIANSTLPGPASRKLPPSQQCNNNPTWKPVGKRTCEITAKHLKT